MSLPYQPLHSITLMASQAVTNQRFVDSAGKHAVSAADAVGISEQDCQPDRAFSALTGYSGLVEAGAAIAAGSLVKPAGDGSGRAVPGSNGDSCGRAVTDAARAGDVLVVRFLEVAGGGGSMSGAGTSADVVVYGATASGIMAACAASRDGASTLLISQKGRLGGMVTGGLARTDYRGYNPRVAMNVMTAEFWRRCAAKYGLSLAQFGMDTTSQFAVEPKVALAVFREMLRDYNVTVMYGWRVTALNKQAGDLRYMDLQKYKGTETARVFSRIQIDASYEGDVLIRSGVPYVVGREANATYGETYNGVRASAALTGSPSPYIVAGDAASGLLPFVDPTPLEAAGTADGRLQAFCHRLVMTNVGANRRPIPEPTTYNPMWYELLGRAMANAPTLLDSLDELFYRAPIPQPGGKGKADWNNRGAVSLDFVGGNFGFVTTDYAAQDAIVQAHEDYTLGLFKFLREDPRVPTALKTALSEWGFCADEFVEDNETGMSPELYVREGPRMLASYIMTEANWAKTATGLTEPIALANYAMDSHPCSKRNIGGVAHAEGGLSSDLVSVGYYGIEYRCMLPRLQDCGNLLVCCNGIGFSHTIFGSGRMEVTFMSLGEAAGVAAALSIKTGRRLHELTGADIAPLVRPYQVNASRVLTVNAPTTNGVARLSSTPPSGWVYSTFPPEFYATQMVNEGNGNKGGRWADFYLDLPVDGRYRLRPNLPGSHNSQPSNEVFVWSADTPDYSGFMDHKLGEWHFRDLGIFRSDEQAGLRSVSSLVIAGAVAVATVPSGHPFRVGRGVQIEGATVSGGVINGSWEVTAVSATTVTFAATGITNQTATGTITAKPKLRVRFRNGGDPAIAGSTNGILSVDGIAWDQVP